MGFFHVEEAKSDDFLRGVSVEFLHQHQCKVCPLAKQQGLTSPHMAPSGSDSPIIYILGGAPSAEDDAKGIQFSGKAGRLMNFRIPRDWQKHLRFNNVVRTRPPNGDDPGMAEVECCRPSVVRDIEETKPVAIFGYGNIPLKWVIGEIGVTKWCGRRIPVKIGKHTCWYYPMMHPSDVLRTRRYAPQTTHEFGSDEEFVFAADMKRAFSEVEDLPDPVVHTEADATAGVRCIDGSGGWRDVDAVEDHLKACAREELIGFDYEANRTRPFAAGAKILSFAASGLVAGTLAVALYHRGSKWSREQREAVLDLLEDFFYTAPCTKLAHNVVYELEWTGYFFGRKAIRAQPWGDSISQAYILDERQGMLKLGLLTLQYFGINIKKIFNVDTTNLDSVPVNRVLTYNGVDAKYHLLLYLEQEKRLEEEGLTEVYEQQLRRAPTMALTQLNGVPVDMDENQRLWEEFGGTLDDAADALAKLACVKTFRSRKGRDFIPSSNPDTLYLLKSILGYTDVPNSDKAVLKGINHEFCELMLEYREAYKIVSTYLDPLRDPDDRKSEKNDKPSCVFPDGLMHPSFAITKTRTWRTSSEDTNVQNWPKRDHKEIRKQVRHKYKKIVSFDYAGIQARNVAMESRDKNLVAAFWDRYDIHRDWMERIIQLHPKWVTEGAKNIATDKDLASRYRSIAKNKLVFPLFFGAQPKSVARDLNASEHVGEVLSEEFWHRFSGIKDWQERTRDNYTETGYVTGLSGFRRRAPVAWTEIINTPIQSDEAAIVCDAMNRLSELGDDRYQASLEIHDDLTFIWDADEVDKNAEVVIGMMLKVPFEWAQIVPLGVEMSIGDNWAEQKQVGEYFSDHWDGNFKRHT